MQVQHLHAPRSRVHGETLPDTHESIPNGKSHKTAPRRAHGRAPSFFFLFGLLPRLLSSLPCCTCLSEGDSRGPRGV